MKATNKIKILGMTAIDADNSEALSSHGDESYTRIIVSTKRLIIAKSCVRGT
jgi:hypothetical protein